MIGIEETNGFQQYDGTSVPDAVLDPTSTNSVQNKVICNALSHVGMIIQSTTLDTEAKVKAIYGSETSWIQHNGYILRGASTGVTANQATKDGGEDTHTLTIAEMPYHDHGHGIYRANEVGYVPANGLPKSATSRTDASGIQNQGGAWTDRAHNNTVGYGFVQPNGGNGAHNIMQSYKNVYIWERTA